MSFSLSGGTFFSRFELFAICWYWCHSFCASRVLVLSHVLLPPAYVVRREGNSFTLFVCPHLGGVPISHNALQHFPECHEAAGGGPGTPPRGTRSGTPPGGVPGQVPPPGGSGYPPGVWVPPRGVRVPPGGVPSQVPPRGRPKYPPGGGPGTPLGVPSQVPPRGEVRVTPPGGVPGQVPPRGVRVPPGGYPVRYPPPGGGYPVRTTEGVLTTRRAVCLLRSRRRTF